MTNDDSNERETSMTNNESGPPGSTTITGHGGRVLGWSKPHHQPAADLARALEGPACHGPSAGGCMVCGLGFAKWHARDEEGIVLSARRDPARARTDLRLRWVSGDEYRLTLNDDDMRDLELSAPAVGQWVRIRVAWPDGCEGMRGRVVALRTIKAFGANGPVGEVKREPAPLGSATLMTATAHGFRPMTEVEMRALPAVSVSFLRVEDTLTAEDRAAFAQRLKDIGMAPGLTLNVVARREVRAGQAVTAEDAALPIDRTPSPTLGESPVRALMVDAARRSLFQRFAREDDDMFAERAGAVGVDLGKGRDHTARAFVQDGRVVPDPLAPWRALAAAVAGPALVEAVLRDWRGRDPEARVSWDQDDSRHRRLRVRFFLAYRSFRTSFAATQGGDWRDVAEALQCAWHCALEHEHAARGR